MKTSYNYLKEMLSNIWDWCEASSSACGGQALISTISTSLYPSP